VYRLLLLHRSYRSIVASAEMYDQRPIGIGAPHTENSNCQPMTCETIHVYIVEGDSSVRTAFARLLRSAHMEPLTFDSVEELLKAEFSDENGCVLCEIDLHGISGLELPSLLARAGHRVPVISITSQDTAESRDMARQAGFAAYLCKPVDDRALLDVIKWEIAMAPHR
jgi:FixJ family two-component response regulator